MSSLAMKAYLSLIQFDTYLVRRNFVGLYNTVRSCPVTKKSLQQNAIERACSATDMACLWYWKEVLCLQRSATTACLLRRLGIEGKMVIGVQQIPFKAHAWVEVDGRVVNDKPYMREAYAVLDVC
jgi:Transglutaminase-like superfamily